MYIVTDCSANNLESLLKASYPQSVVRCLTVANPGDGVPLATARALVASLLNAVASDHSTWSQYFANMVVDQNAVPTKSVLTGDTNTLGKIIEMTGSFMSHDSTSPEEKDAWAGIAVWTWRIIEDLAEHS